jgi:hypothetical protein
LGGELNIGVLNLQLDGIFLDAASLDAFAQSLGLDAGEFDATQLRDCDRNKLKDLVRNEVIKCHGEKNLSSAKLTSRIANAFMGLYIYISAHFHSNKLFGANMDASVRAAKSVSQYPDDGWIDEKYMTVRAIDVPSGEDSMLWAFEAGSNPENLGTNGDARLIARDRTIPQYRDAISDGLNGEVVALRQEAATAATQDVKSAKNKKADELERRAKSGAFKPEDMRHLSKHLKKDIAIVIQGEGSTSSILLCTKDGEIKTVTQDDDKRLHEALGSGYAIFIEKDGHCSGLKNDPAFAMETKGSMEALCGENVVCFDSEMLENTENPLSDGSDDFFDSTSKLCDPILVGDSDGDESSDLSGDGGGLPYEDEGV